MSIPTSAMAWTTVGWTASAGSVPPERASTRPAARRRRKAAAIWLRPALWTQTNSTVGRLSKLIHGLSWLGPLREHLVDPGSAGIEQTEHGHGYPRPDQLGEQEGRHRAGRDPGEGVRQGPRHGDGWVGEAGRGGEPVGRRDVGPRPERDQGGPTRADEAEDHEEQTERGQPLAQPEVGPEPGPRRELHRGQAEHQVGE